jgi:hypothetical protein
MNPLTTINQARSKLHDVTIVLRSIELWALKKHYPGIAADSYRVRRVLETYDSEQLEAMKATIIKELEYHGQANT